MAFQLELFIIQAGPPSFGEHRACRPSYIGLGKIADVADQFN
jgi:hypothetical protein